MTDILETIGMSKEELRVRVIDACVQHLLSTTRTHYDEDGAPYETGGHDSDFARKVKQEIEDRVKAEVRRISEEEVAPKVGTLLENIVFRPTNRYGEPKEEPLTLREYVIKEADAYLREDVDGSGKTRSESGSYSWSKYTTRGGYIVGVVVREEVMKAFKTVLKSANDSLAEVVQGAVNARMAEVVATIKASIAKA